MVVRVAKCEEIKRGRECWDWVVECEPKTERAKCDWESGQRVVVFVPESEMGKTGRER